MADHLVLSPVRVMSLFVGWCEARFWQLFYLCSVKYCVNLMYVYLYSLSGTSIHLYIIAHPVLVLILNSPMPLLSPLGKKIDRNVQYFTHLMVKIQITCIVFKSSTEGMPIKVQSGSKRVLPGLCVVRVLSPSLLTRARKTKKKKLH